MAAYIIGAIVLKDRLGAKDIVLINWVNLMENTDRLKNWQSRIL